MTSGPPKTLQQTNIDRTVGEDSAAVSTEPSPNIYTRTNGDMKKSSACLCFTETLAANICSGPSAAVDVRHGTRTQNRLQSYLTESRLVLIQVVGESKITHLA